MRFDRRHSTATTVAVLVPLASGEVAEVLAGLDRVGGVPGTRRTLTRILPRTAAPGGTEGERDHQPHRDAASAGWSLVAWRRLARWGRAVDGRRAAARRWLVAPAGLGVLSPEERSEDGGGDGERERRTTVEHVISPSAYIGYALLQALQEYHI
jgi:hypothetical protein